MFIIRKRYDAKEYNSNLTESSDNKLMNGWNSVVELNMNTNDEMEMIKRMKNRVRRCNGNDYETNCI